MILKSSLAGGIIVALAGMLLNFPPTPTQQKPEPMLHSDAGFLVSYWNGQDTPLYRAAMQPAMRAATPAKKR